MADEGPVLFYERRFYCFSNFSSFAFFWQDAFWPTAEHAYQAAKFPDGPLQMNIHDALSAHDAKQFAHLGKDFWRHDWQDVKLDVMESILRAKLAQHRFVQQRLLETGEREIIEDSPTDSFWGWGPDKKGENNLGKLWMQLRAELRARH